MSGVVLTQRTPTVVPRRRCVLDVGTRARLRSGVRSADLAWSYVRLAAVELVIAGRATCGRHGGVDWAVSQLQLWVESVDVDDLDEAADDVEMESAATAARARNEPRS